MALGRSPSARSCVQPWPSRRVIILDQTASRQSRASQVLLFWLAAFVLANFASLLVVVVTGNDGSSSGDLSTLVVALSATAMWLVYLFATTQFLQVNLKNLRSTIGVTFLRRDVVVGIPLGIASQLILVNAVNWPLARLFPDAFSFDEVSQRASDLVDVARGGWVVLLGLVVIVGAPIVEEIVYRGVVQPGLVASWGRTGGLMATAVLFAAIHMRPVEFPGLLAFALVLGWARHSTGTIGRSIVIHMAFNATGLALVVLL
ncbi:MAG: CPBP family intramembrane metalloprotease [Ilumatobacteraceae bacterium]|nr:CPBP family intramembrane metalloprotease [Ilumatobacteraceae bacterium]